MVEATALSRSEIERRVRSLAETIVGQRSDGLFVDWVEYRREGGRWYLRVFLDHPKAVTLEHCQDVARELGEVLDREDLIDHAYNLEVSSPGLERPLRREGDFERFKGRLVTLRLFRPLNGGKVVSGRLAGLSPDGEVAVELEEGRTVRVALADVARANLAVDWRHITTTAGGRESGGGDR